MNYHYSKHAAEQIANRNLNRKIIDNVILFPDVMIKQDECLTIFQKIVISDKNKKPYLYRVFINTCKDPSLVITAYKTSKIEKYENKI